MAQVEPLYRRVLLKLSGDAFSAHDTGFGISPESTADLARQLTDVAQALGVQMAVVVASFAYNTAARDEKLPRKPLRAQMCSTSATRGTRDVVIR